MSNHKLDYYEAMELGALILGIDEDSNEDFENEIEEGLYNKYDLKMVLG